MAPTISLPALMGTPPPTINTFSRKTNRLATEGFLAYRMQIRRRGTSLPY
jgi:hypothetical protein